MPNFTRKHKDQGQCNVLALGKSKESGVKNLIYIQPRNPLSIKAIKLNGFEWEGTHENITRWTSSNKDLLRSLYKRTEDEHLMLLLIELRLIGGRCIGERIV